MYVVNMLTQNPIDIDNFRFFFTFLRFVVIIILTRFFQISDKTSKNALRSYRETFINNVYLLTWSLVRFFVYFRFYVSEVWVFIDKRRDFQDHNSSLHWAVFMRTLVDIYLFNLPFVLFEYNSYMAMKSYGTCFFGKSYERIISPWRSSLLSNCLKIKIDR